LGIGNKLRLKPFGLAVDRGVSIPLNPLKKGDFECLGLVVDRRSFDPPKSPLRRGTLSVFGFLVDRGVSIPLNPLKKGDFECLGLVVDRGVSIPLNPS
jgi:hypothetical protein